LSRFRFPDPPLTDGVVVVRRIRAGDVEAIVAACQDPLIKRFTSAIPDPYDDADARHWIAGHERMLEQEVPLAFAADGFLVGTTGLHSADWRHRRADTGYWTAPDARGHGFASRALRLVCDWAFAEYDLVRIGLYADVSNVASHRVAERAGFEREGVHRRFMVMAGESRDCVAYGRVRS
jgi:RimJ/RimL family protein N-acetyltransferase